MQSNLLKTIVVDDEQPSRDALIQSLRDYCPEVEVVAECDSAKSACQAIKQHRPDLVFLDIEMPRGSGFDLLEMFHPAEFRVIFVTAFSNYAVQAFRYAAVDYLLKPIKVTELTDAVTKAINGSSPLSQKFNILLENLHQPDSRYKRLAIYHSKGFEVISTSDIICCEADTYCTIFHLTGHKQLTSSHILKYYEEILPEEQFIRVHHSFIINKEHIKSYTSQGEIILSEEIHCPLSIARKTEFMKIFKTWKK
jgi:two-component system, LytTR family, response regulator